MNYFTVYIIIQYNVGIQHIVLVPWHVNSAIKLV